jgi:cellulose synthase (UDP-forming)
VKAKAGNLNHALPRTSGEFVAVIDCDHRADPLFAHELLGYFADSEVGFVTTRQEFHGEDADLLGARDPLFYNWQQPAKDSGNAAFSTGNAVVYRRAALDSSGGFSEWSIVEDLHTSMRIHERGWRSVYHNRPVTVGVAPDTSAALVQQRLTWATDSTRIFLFDNPLLKRGLTLKQKLHYAHTTGYNLVACTYLFFLVSPALWLIWQVPVMSPASTASYLAYSLPYAGSIFALLLLYGGWRGIRSVQQQFYLAPVFLVSAGRAATGIRFRSGVTDKAMRSRFSPLAIPQQLLAALLVAGIVVAVAHPAPGQGAAVAWAGFMAYSLASFVTTATGRPAVDRALRIGLRTAIVVAAAVVILPVGALRRDLEGKATAGAGPPRVLAPPERGAYVGVFNPSLLDSPQGIDAWDRQHAVKAGIVGWYQQWFGGQTQLRLDWLDTVARQGAIPMITWEPRADGTGQRPRQRKGSVLAAIAAGDYDSYIRSWARAAASYGGPLLIRPMHDLNGSWYPWSVGLDGNSPRLFVAAWRHIHDVFVDEGAVNVGWVWSVYSVPGRASRYRQLASSYPGSAYVDWVAMAGLEWSPVRGTFGDLYRGTYDALARFGKPVMVSQIGAPAAQGSSAAWIGRALRRIPGSYPLVKAVVWFDAPYSRRVDFRLRGAARAAFDAGVQAPYWRQSPRILPAHAEDQPREGTR